MARLRWRWRGIRPATAVLLGGLLLAGCDKSLQDHEGGACPEPEFLASPEGQGIAKALRMSVPGSTDTVAERMTWGERLHAYPPRDVALVVQELYLKATSADERARVLREGYAFVKRSEAAREALLPVCRVAKRAIVSPDPQVATEAGLILSSLWGDDAEAKTLIAKRLDTAEEPALLYVLFQFFSPSEAGRVLLSELNRPCPADESERLQWETRLRVALDACRVSPHDDHGAIKDRLLEIIGEEDPAIAGSAVFWFVRVEAKDVAPRLEAMLPSLPVYAQYAFRSALAALDPAESRWLAIHKYAAAALAGYARHEVGAPELRGAFGWGWLAAKWSNSETLAVRLVKTAASAQMPERAFVFRALFDNMEGNPHMALVGLEACGEDGIREVLKAYPDVREVLVDVAVEAQWELYLPDRLRPDLVPTYELLDALHQEDLVGQLDG